MESRLRFTQQKQGIEIRYQLCQVNQDFLLVVEGGDLPHIGSVTLADHLYFESLKGKNHREYIITEAIASEIKAHTRTVVCVIGGIHIDGITAGQIQLVQEMCRQGAQEVCRWLDERQKFGADD